MKEEWQNESKWEMAVTTLSQLIDSFQILNRDFEIGIRILGHQYPKSEHRCDDSKLEIPFSKDLNFQKVHSTLKRFTPKGQTPLAYSISLSEQDFPQDISALHSVILITDGLENCDGNPCEVSLKLQEKNIFITPYIIGLGIDSLESQKLECIGKFIDAKNKGVFKSVIKNILSDVATKTTLSVFFIKPDSSLVQHYVPYSLIDKRSKRDISNFIYTPNSKRSLDTILVNTQYQYDLAVHTTPPIILNNCYLSSGMHQNWYVTLQEGSIELEPKEKKVKQSYQITDRTRSYYGRVNNVASYPYLTSELVQLDLIQYPISSEAVRISEQNPSNIFLTQKGLLQYKTTEKVIASLYTAKWDLVSHLTVTNSSQTIELISGNYYIVYKKFDDAMEKTMFSSLHIPENQTVQILLP